MKNILLLLFLANMSIFSQEMIRTNSSFERGLTFWQFGVASYDEDTPDAEFEIVNKGLNDEFACKVKLRISTNSGNYNDAYLMYGGLKIKKGKKYRITFYIKSNFRNDKIFITVGSGKSPDIQVLESREQKFVGNNIWQKVSYTFQASKDKDNVDFRDLSLFFGFNHRFGTFYIDDVSLAPFKK